MSCQVGIHRIRLSCIDRLPQDWTRAVGVSFPSCRASAAPLHSQARREALKSWRVQAPDNLASVAVRDATARVRAATWVPGSESIAPRHLVRRCANGTWLSMRSRTFAAQDARNNLSPDWKPLLKDRKEADALNLELYPGLTCLFIPWPSTSRRRDLEHQESLFVIPGATGR